MASRSLGEAILRALAGAGQELGGQMQDNQRFNLQRGDAFQRLKEQRDWRRQQAERDQANADRAYNYRAGRDEARQAQDYRGGIDKNISDRLAGIEEKNRYQTAQDWAAKQFGLDVRRENRLAGGGTTQPKAHPAGGEAVRAHLAGRQVAGEGGRMYQPEFDQAGLDTLTSLKMTAAYPQGKPGTWNPMAGGSDLLAQFAKPGMSAVAELNQPDSLDEWGRAEYGEDWDLATPQQRQAIARKRGIM